MRIVARRLVCVSSHPGVSAETPFTTHLIIAVDVFQRILGGKRQRITVGSNVVDLRSGSAVRRVPSRESHDSIEFWRQNSPSPIHIGSGNLWGLVPDKLIHGEGFEAFGDFIRVCLWHIFEKPFWIMRAGTSQSCAWADTIHLCPCGIRATGIDPSDPCSLGQHDQSIIVADGSRQRRRCRRFGRCPLFKSRKQLPLLR